MARREKVLLMVSTAPSTLDKIGGRKSALFQIVLSYWVRMSKEYPSPPKRDDDMKFSTENSAPEYLAELGATCESHLYRGVALSTTETAAPRLSRGDPTTSRKWKEVLFSLPDRARQRSGAGEIFVLTP